MPPRILIVGAGIAGLALSRALRDHGLAHDLVERDPEPRTEGAGIFLPANAVRALGALGIGAPGHPITRMRVVDHRGRGLLDMPMDEIWGPGSRCVCLPRAELHRLLGAGVPVRYSVSKVEPDGYDLVVGADGIRSAVRRSAFPAASVRPVGVVAWRFLVSGYEPAGVWCGWQARDRAFLAISLGGGRAYCYAEARSAPAGDWRALFADFAPTVRGLVAQGGDAHHGPIEEVEVADPVAGRTVLVGDAARANPPNMAQGAAMAFEDALVLAEHLAKQPMDEALAAYAARRAPRVAFVRTHTRRRDKARRLPPVLRDPVMRLAGPAIVRSNFRLLRAEP
jgi:2-polyprenyl-6-methoxyphenol hydroxylase-like FAD-dependent oxidoreductase